MLIVVICVSVCMCRGTNKLDHIISRDYFLPGRYTIELPLHPPESFLLVIGMINDHGQYFEDTVYVSMSTRFYVWLKYMLFVPAALLYVPLLMMRRKAKTD